MEKPKAVNGIEGYLLFKYKDPQKEDIYCVGSIELDRYIKVTESQKTPIIQAISFFDGEHTIEEIEEEAKRTFHISINAKQLYEILSSAGLLVQQDGEKKGEIEENEFDKYGIRLASINLRKVQKFFIYPEFVNLMFFAICLISIIIAIPALPKVLKGLLVFNIYKTVNSSMISLIISMALTTMSVILHEYAHAAIAKGCGLTPREMDISLYLYLTPMAYIIIPGIYTLPRKRRLEIWSAGILMNLLIFSVSTSLQMFCVGTVHNLFMLLAYTNLGLIITNFIPFLPLDGYFLMSTFLKIPNLRRKAFHLNEMKKTSKKSLIYIVYLALSIVASCYLIILPFVQSIFNFGIAYKRTHSFAAGVKEVWMYIVVLCVVMIAQINAHRRSRNNERNGGI